MLLRHYLEQGTSKSALARQRGGHRDTIHRWIRAGELDRDLDGEPVLHGVVDCLTGDHDVVGRFNGGANA